MFLLKMNRFKILLCLVVVSTNIFANKVGIIGDIHCNLAALDQAVVQMKKDNITDIIVTGDLIFKGSSCPTDVIQQVHDKLVKVVPENKLYVIPGNWEVDQQKVNQMNTVFGSRMITQSCVTPTAISIDGKNIRVTHEPPIDHAFSQHIDPTKSPFARYNPDYTPHRPKSVPEILPKKNVDLDIFGDSHVRTAFFTTEGVPVINPGALIATDKKTGSTSYATYDTRTNEVLFYNPEASGANKMITSPEDFVTKNNGHITLVGGPFNASKLPTTTAPKVGLLTKIKQMFNASKSPTITTPVSTSVCAPTPILTGIPNLQDPGALAFFNDLSTYLDESVNETVKKSALEKKDLALIKDLINGAWICRQDPNQRILELLQKSYWNSSKFSSPERSLFHLQNAIAKYLAKSPSAGNTYFDRSKIMQTNDFKIKFKDQLKQSTTKYTIPMPLTTQAPTTIQDKNSAKLIEKAESEINLLIDNNWDKNRKGQSEPKTATENVRRIKDILLNDPSSPFKKTDNPVRTHIINALNRMMLRDIQ